MPRPLWSAADRARLEAELSDRSARDDAEVATVDEASTVAGKAPSDVPPPVLDEPLRDDHVFEAFTDTAPAPRDGADGNGAGSPTAEAMAQDCPRGEDAEAMLSPSAAVFHSHTLPLALPAQFTRSNWAAGSTSASRSRSPTEPVVQLSAAPTRRSSSPRSLAPSPTTSEHRAGEQLALFGLGSSPREGDVRF